MGEHVTGEAIKQILKKVENGKSKYCVFLETLKDSENNIVWEQGKEYLITYEDNELYCFGIPVESGIEKGLQNVKFVVVEK